MIENEKKEIVDWIKELRDRHDKLGWVSGIVVAIIILICGIWSKYIDSAYEITLLIFISFFAIVCVVMIDITWREIRLRKKSQKNAPILFDELESAKKDYDEKVNEYKNLLKQHEEQKMIYFACISIIRHDLGIK